jgi:hypothetical protein
MSASQRIEVPCDIDASAVLGVCFPIEVQFRVGIAPRPRCIFGVICGDLLLRSVQRNPRSLRPPALSTVDRSSVGELSFMPPK